MKRLTLLVLALVTAPYNIFALDPGQQILSDASFKRPAYPILPSQTTIIGGQMIESLPGVPMYIPSPDFSDGKTVLGINNPNCNPLDGLVRINANPAWDSTHKMQEMDLLLDIDKKPMFLGNPTSDMSFFMEHNIIIIKEKKPAKNDGLVKYSFKAMDLDYKTIFQISAEDTIQPTLTPISRSYFLFLRSNKSNVLDKAGRSIIEGKEISVCEDPYKRFAIVDGKLFEFSKMDFAPIDVYMVSGHKTFVFKPDCLEVLNVSPDTDLLKAWRFSYSWDLLETFETYKPTISSDMDWRLLLGDCLVYYERNNKSKACGWHLYDWKKYEDRFFLPCSSFSDIAQKARICGNKMFIPTPEGGCIVDLERLTADNRHFPLETSILDTPNGYFAIGFACQTEGMVAGFMLDENLNPIENTRTILPKATNYIAFEKKIISLWQTYEQYYDTFKKTDQFNISLSLSFSYIGESSPKKITHFKFKSRHTISTGLGCSVYKGVLYIPTGVADYFSIDLTTLKSQSFWNDELFFKYSKDLAKRPRFFANEQIFAFLFVDSRLFIFDKWKNLKLDADIRPMGGNSMKKAWIWWDKLLVAFDSYAMVYKLDGTSQFIDGKPVDFSNGFYTYIQKELSGQEKMVGRDIDTSYQRTFWQSMPNRAGGGNIAKIGADFFSNGTIIDSESVAIQTGINGISCQNVDSGCAFFMEPNVCAEGRGSGKDNFISKWSPASTYSIKRTYANEFMVTSTRGDGKTQGFNGIVYICSWNDHGNIPTLTKLSEVAQIKNLQFGQSIRFRIKMPDGLGYSNTVDETPCFSLLVIGNGLLDVPKSTLEHFEQLGRPLFDGTPVDMTCQMAACITVWQEK